MKSICCIHEWHVKKTAQNGNFICVLFFFKFLSASHINYSFIINNGVPKPKILLHNLVFTSKDNIKYCIGKMQDDKILFI